MRSLLRLLQRLAILGLGVLSVWVIVVVIFKRVDHRLPLILALSATYGLAAYVVLPLAVRMGLRILLHRRVPRFTVTGDGLPGDPVNVALIGSAKQLRASFAKAGWCGADALGIASSWRMAKAFLFNTPYPTAPFSTLFLFGRGQDLGFQKAIDDSPRKRHHIRFWAVSSADAAATVGTADFWHNRKRPTEDEPVIWVGAGTRDTGLGLTRITFKITHATDSDTDAERDFVMAELEKGGEIGAVKMHHAGDHLTASDVNRYTTDGDVAVATLQG